MLFMYNIDIADHVSGIPQTSGRLNITIDKSDAVSPNWSTMYKMTSEPRGYCLIINNRYFTGMYSYTFFSYFYWFKLYWQFYLTFYVFYLQIMTKLLTFYHTNKRLERKIQICQIIDKLIIFIAIILSLEVCHDELLCSDQL